MSGISPSLPVSQSPSLPVSIFLDFGNVIAFFDHQRAVAQLSRYTHLAPAELTILLYGGTLEDDYERNRISTSEYIAAARADARLTCTDEQFIAAFGDIFTPNQEVIALLPLLKPHHRLVLASNTNEAHHVRFRYQFADALKNFDAIVVSYEAGARKPERDFFAYAQGFAECNREECLFIDDLPSNVEGARAFGWQGVVYEGVDSLVHELRSRGVRGLDDIAGAAS